MKNLSAQSASIFALAKSVPFLASIAILFIATLTVSSCKKPATDTTEKAEAGEENVADSDAPEANSERAAAEEKPSDENDEAVARVEKRAEEFRTAIDAEKERWKKEGINEKYKKLTAKPFANTRKALKAILASPHRSAANRARDKYRHPKETLEFLGIKPTDTVVELGAGAGWYTEILAPLLFSKGKLFAAGPDPKGPKDQMGAAYGKRFVWTLKKSPLAFGKVQAVYLSPESLRFGPAGVADAALAFREMHNWYRSGKLNDYLKAVHMVLKDGGTFGVVQHRAKKGSDPDESAEKGYLAEDWVKKTVEAAGFKFVGSSKVNANPKDTKDYERGVWTLPPSYRLGDTEHKKYEEIGESDRMTLKFKKVADK